MFKPIAAIFACVCLVFSTSDCFAGKRAVRKRCSVPTTPSCPAPVSNSASTKSVPAELPSDPEKRLAEILRRWQESRKSRSSIYAEFERTLHDPAFGNFERSPGSFRFVEEHKWRIDVPEGDNAATTYSIPIDEGWLIYSFQALLKTMTLCTFSHVPPDEKSDSAGQSVFSQLSAISQLSRVAPLIFFAALPDENFHFERFRFSIQSETDAHFTIACRPIGMEDNEVFHLMEMDLRKSDCRLQRLKIVEPNRNEITFDIQRWMEDVEFDSTDFEPSLIAGWRTQKCRFDLPKSVVKSSR